MTSPIVWRTLRTLQAGTLLMLLLTGPGSLPGAEPKEAKFLLAWGKKGDKPGEFYSPIGIAIDRRDVDAKQCCRIAHAVSVGGLRSDETTWPEIQDALIDGMVRLERASRPQITALKAEFS
jgi:hypothetical protein